VDYDSDTAVVLTFAYRDDISQVRKKPGHRLEDKQKVGRDQP
jgi:hypothetical protein